METTTLRERFRKEFGHVGELYFAPGRINLIGEHTDYNCGFVLPGAVTKGITVEISPNGGRSVKLLAIDISENKNSVEFDLDSPTLPSTRWARYIYGVCMELQKRGVKVGGFSAAFTGNVPLGAGMSSSAALESAFAVALNNMFAGGGIDKFELAKIGQATEHNYCGVKCGIMDQFASIFGKEGSLMLLDCRSLEYDYIPFNLKGYKLVLVNSEVKHALGNEYNERRESCERVVARLDEVSHNIHSLRDADMDMLEAVRSDLSYTDFHRAKYILEENRRVLDVCKYLKEENYPAVGRLLFEAHQGFSHDYNCSCSETDCLVELASEAGGSGSRLMGGGFGGCTINLVREDLEQSFIEQVTKGYTKQFGINPSVYQIEISAGAGAVTEQ